MSALLTHTWTDEIDGRTFSVCETDNLTPCQREILNLRRRHDALADALEGLRRAYAGNGTVPRLEAWDTAKVALRAAGRLA